MSDSMEENEGREAKARENCGTVPSKPPLEDDGARQVEECLAAALAARRPGSSADAVLRLGPGPQERVWATRVGFGGSVEIVSWPEAEPAAARVEWVYPSGTGFEDQATGLGRMTWLYWTSGGDDEGLKRWLEDMPRLGQGEPEAC